MKIENEFFGTENEFIMRELLENHFELCEQIVESVRLEAEAKIHDSDIFLGKYGLSVEKIKGHNDYYDAKMKKYLTADTKYDLYADINSEKFSLKDWYIFVGSGFSDSQNIDTSTEGCTMFSYEYDAGRQAINRLKKNLKEIFGIYVDDIGKAVAENENYAKDLVKLITFLLRISNEMNVKYAQLFSKPSMENSEYIPDEGMCARNEAVIGIIRGVISEMVRYDVKQAISFFMFEYSALENEVRENLLDYLSYRECDTQLLLQYKKDCERLCQKIRNMTYNSASKKQKNLFEEMLYKLDLNYIKNQATDMKKACESICDHNLSEIKPCIVHELLKDEVPMEKIADYASSKEKTIISICQISKKKFKNIVETYIGMYAQVFDEGTVFDGLHILCMVMEVIESLTKSVFSEKSPFYRYKTSDIRTTLKSALRTGESPIIMKMILEEQLMHRYYYYLGRESEYIIVNDIIKQMQDISLLLVECDCMDSFVEYFDTIRNTYQTMLKREH